MNKLRCIRWKAIERHNRWWPSAIEQLAESNKKDRRHFSFEEFITDRDLFRGNDGGVACNTLENRGPTRTNYG